MADTASLWNIRVEMKPRRYRLAPGRVTSTLELLWTIYTAHHSHVLPLSSGHSASFEQNCHLWNCTACNFPSEKTRSNDTYFVIKNSQPFILMYTMYIQRTFDQVQFWRYNNQTKSLLPHQTFNKLMSLSVSLSICQGQSIIGLGTKLISFNLLLFY